MSALSDREGIGRISDCGAVLMVHCDYPWVICEAGRSPDCAAASQTNQMRDLIRYRNEGFARYDPHQCDAEQKQYDTLSVAAYRFQDR